MTRTERRRYSQELDDIDVAQIGGDPQGAMQLQTDTSGSRAVRTTPFPNSAPRAPSVLTTTRMMLALWRNSAELRSRSASLKGCPTSVRLKRMRFVPPDVGTEGTENRDTGHTGGVTVEVRVQQWPRMPSSRAHTRGTSTKGPTGFHRGLHEVQRGVSGLRQGFL